MARLVRIDDIVEANIKNGFYFFATSSMKFFNSRVLKEVYGGKYFITSERSGTDPRRYTIRVFDPETGSVETAEPDGFQRYHSPSQARLRIATILREEGLKP